MGIHTDVLTVDLIQGRFGGLFTNYGFKFERPLLVREVDEEPLLQVEELEVILGLNSVSLVELTYRLELYDSLAVHDEVGSDVADVQTRIVHRDYPLRLIIDSLGPQSHLKGTVVHGLAVARPEGRPDVLGHLTQTRLHGF